MHPNNPHQGKYELQALIQIEPNLKPFVFINKFNKETIDFHDASAVKMLNKALLKKYYNIRYWDIPKGYLSPPVPGRADYIHCLSDFITEKDKVITGAKIKILDIGVGANCIYPLIGHGTFGWSFVGSDIDPVALDNAKNIIHNNGLTEVISLRQQKDQDHILTNIIKDNEYFDALLCNPPFNESASAATKSRLRKIKNLNQPTNAQYNFGGQRNELYYEGGEINFISKLIKESRSYSTSVYWYSTLISKGTNVGKIKSLLNEFSVQTYKINESTLGNKKSRIAFWTYLDPKQQKIWKSTKWK